ncbi:DUF732 domain-containing protein [Mycobacterium sp. 1274756.6]|uniref:DUF732 domain-containing protein n=1 Tax=Mycobacterium sp. 1274756.6 TaxID=1834076 RepID=UPI0007FEEF73|nr:DUF732 domain-containing protein [Mycobacterium sp. 1274756.6]OBJ72975.1 hypothetical protein A5643_04740 [Mycobacterium sp. 1274756.6]
MTFRAPVSAAALIVAAALSSTALAAPAAADPVDDTFLNALDNAGLGYDDPAEAVRLGQSVCTRLQEPGATAASTAATVAGRGGIQAALAGMFTSIAISMYCPSAMASLADGSMPDLPFLQQIPGMPPPRP